MRKLFSRVLLLASLLITNSCTLLDRGLEWDESTNERFRRITPTDEGIYCENASPPRLQFFSNSTVAQEIFEELYSKSDFRNFNDYEFYVSFILIHLVVRPDLVTPSSRLQTMQLLKESSDVSYYDWHNDQSRPTLLIGLQESLKSHSNRSLENIAGLLDKNLPSIIPVEPGLQDFLHANSDKIANNPQLNQIFIKGNQTVRVGETFSRPSLTNLIRLATAQSKDNESQASALTHLFGPTKIDNNGELMCSFDIELYKNEIYLISDWRNQQNLDIGIYNHRTQKLFISSIATRSDGLTITDQDFLILSSGETNQASFCYYHDKKKNSSFVLASTRGRDPGQFIYQMIEAQIFDSTSSQDILDIHNLARKLILTRPYRILYEEQRSTSDQMQQLFDRGAPIYYANPLGAMTTFASVSKSSGTEETFSGLILDNRRDAKLKCLN